MIFTIRINYNTIIAIYLAYYTESDYFYIKYFFAILFPTLYISYYFYNNIYYNLLY